MAKSKPYEQCESGDTIVIDRDGERRIACCDCGLVHLFHNIGDYKAVITVYRDNRPTGQLRRYHDYPRK